MTPDLPAHLAAAIDALGVPVLAWRRMPPTETPPAPKWDGKGEPPF